MTSRRFTPRLPTHEAAAREVRFSLNQELDISWDALANDNWELEMHRGREPSTHAIARKLKTDACSGILVNSFAFDATPDDVNLVLWIWDVVETLPASSHNAVMVLNRDDLPQNDSSWKQ